MCYLGIGQFIFGRPRAAVAVDPRRAQSSLLCTVHVIKRVVPDVQCLGRTGAPGLYRRIEYGPIGFRRAGHGCIYVIVKQVTNADRLEISIAVGNSDKRCLLYTSDAADDLLQV